MWSCAHVIRSIGPLRFIVAVFMLTCAHVHMSNGLSAQTTGQVRINIVPDVGLQYVLDGKYRMNQREITLSEGDHRFVFWAPEHAMLDTTIFVMGNFTYNLNIKLRRTAEFVEYRSALERYEQKQRLGKWLPPLVAGGFAAWTVVNTIRLIKEDKELRDLSSTYSELADPAAIRRLKYEDIPAAKDDLRSIRTQTYISSGLLVASIGAIAYIRHRQNRSVAPTYQDNERIRFEGLVWIPGPAGGTWASALTIPLR
jgi:hypothetical protein